jgi:hypothetical protein
MDKEKEKLEKVEKAKRLSYQIASRVRQLAKQKGASALAKEVGLSPQNFQNIIDNENANVGNVVLYALIANSNDFDERYYFKGVLPDGNSVPLTDFEVKNIELEKILKSTEEENQRLKMQLEKVENEKTALFNILGKSKSMIQSPLVDDELGNNLMNKIQENYLSASHAFLQNVA